MISSGGFVHTSKSSDVPTAHSCNCVGPRNGDPVCPCMMQSVTIENGRYVRKIDLGPAPAASKAFHSEYSEFNRLMGKGE